MSLACLRETRKKGGEKGSQAIDPTPVFSYSVDCRLVEDDIGGEIECPRDGHTVELSRSVLFDP